MELINADKRAIFHYCSNCLKALYFLKPCYEKVYIYSNCEEPIRHHEEFEKNLSKFIRDYDKLVKTYGKDIYTISGIYELIEIIKKDTNCLKKENFVKENKLKCDSELFIKIHENFKNIKEFLQQDAINNKIKFGFSLYTTGGYRKTRRFRRGRKNRTLRRRR